MKQKRYDDFYMRLAVNSASFSYCKRKQVGAVVVKDDIICYGFNGRAPGLPNICEDENGETLPDVFHAERNALSKFTTSTISSVGATMYSTLSPCINCAISIIQARISRFVYIKGHSDETGLKMLIEANIIVEKINTID